MSWSPGSVEDLGYPACGALGPTVVDDDGAWTILRCRGLPDQHELHGHQARPHRRVWRATYFLLEHLAADIAFTIRDPRHPQGPLGRRTVDELLASHGLLSDVHRHLQALHHAPRPRDPPAQAPASEPQQARPHPKPGLDHFLHHLARLPGRADELVRRLEAAGHPVELCTHVDPDELDQDHHLAVWVKAGVVHVCHEPAAHRKRFARGNPGHRCQCTKACGRSTRSTVFGPLRPTARPEPPL